MSPLRDPLRGRFPSQRLSVLLPLFVLPLELSPSQTRKCGFSLRIHRMISESLAIGKRVKHCYTVSRVLFRKRELTEFCAKLSSARNSVRSFRQTNNTLSLEQRSSVRAKNSRSSVLETVLSETVYSAISKPWKFAILKCDVSV